MNDILDRLTRSAWARIDAGYYELESPPGEEPPARSYLRELKATEGDPIVAEIKRASPSRGRLLEERRDPKRLAESYRTGGAAGFSVLTDPNHFQGSLRDLDRVSRLGKPVLMKDFVLHQSQLEAGSSLGADAVLFIHRLFDRDLPAFTLEEGIDRAHDLGLEVLLETNDEAEYGAALKTEADMIGINNRDLRNLEVDLSTTEQILGKLGKDRPVWAMSGITGRGDVECLKKAGADIFLVGTSLARAEQPKALLGELRGVRVG